MKKAWITTIFFILITVLPVYSLMGESRESLSKVMTKNGYELIKTYSNSDIWINISAGITNECVYDDNNKNILQAYSFKYPIKKTEVVYSLIAATTNYEKIATTKASEDNTMITFLTKNYGGTIFYDSNTDITGFCVIDSSYLDCSVSDMRNGNCDSE